MNVETLEPAFLGLDTDSAPDYLNKRRAPVLANFLVDRPGSLPMRGPITDAIDLSTSPLAGKPVSAVVHNNNLLIGLKVNSAAALRDPWVAPYRRAAAEADLGVGHTTAYHVNLETRVVTAVVVTADTCPGPRATRLGDYTWAYAYSRAATGSSVQNGGRQWERRLLRWDGTAVAPTAYVNGPINSQDIRAYLNRLFAAGGFKPGTTTYSPNSLFWSDEGGPTADTLAMWQDNVSGLTNEIIVDSQDPSDFIVALAKMTRGLFIPKRRSLHVLYGATPAAFSLRPITADVGCLDPRSVVEYEGGVFFMSDQGFMYYDGAQLRNTSESLRSSLLAEALATVGDAGVDGGQVAAGRLANGYIGVSIGQSPASTAASDIRFAAIYHVPSGTWSSFESGALAARRPLAFGRGLSRGYVLDDARVFDASGVAAPEAVDAARRGYDSRTPTFTFDLSGGGPLFNGVGNALKNQLTAVEAWTTSIVSPIPAKWYSRLARLAEPTRKATVRRLLVDYTFQPAGGLDEDPEAGTGWYVTLVDGQGAALLTETQLPAQGEPTTYNYRRQHVMDVNAEAADAQLRIEWKGTAQALTQATLHSAYIEFEPAYQRRSS